MQKSDKRNQAKVEIGATEEHYQRVGLSQDTIEEHENGTSTEAGAEDTFEGSGADGACISDRVAFFFPETGVPIANNLLYLYDAGDMQYQVKYQREKTILDASMLPSLTDEQVKQVEQKEGKMRYYRFSGSATITVFENGEVVETQTAPSAMWELLYVGTLEKASSH